MPTEPVINQSETLILSLNIPLATQLQNLMRSLVRRVLLEEIGMLGQGAVASCPELAGVAL